MMELAYRNKLSDACEPWGYVAPVVAAVVTRTTGVRHIYLIGMVPKTAWVDGGRGSKIPKIPYVVQEYKNCTVWESTESRQISTRTLQLIAQAVIPWLLSLAPVCLVFLFVFAICKDDCCDDD